MLASDIVLYARDLATMPSTSFYSDVEAYRAINMQWRRMYSLFLENDDDFYLTKWDFDVSLMSVVADRQSTYKISFPAGVLRLRMLQAKYGTTWQTLEKMTRFEFGTTVNVPGYLILGTELWITDLNSSRVYQAFYYPAPVTIIASTDVNYPISMIPEILAYTVAMEIRRKQQLDVSSQQAMRDELWKAMLKMLNRDDNRAQPIKNAYANNLGWLGQF